MLRMWNVDQSANQSGLWQQHFVSEAGYSDRALDKLLFLELVNVCFFIL